MALKSFVTPEMLNSIRENEPESEQWNPQPDVGVVFDSLMPVQPEQIDEITDVFVTPA